MRVPVLTYHSNNIHGNACGDNDHVALAGDLAELAALGWRVVPLQHVVEVLLGTAPGDLDRCVALSFDDGSWFDWHELEHPTWGPQRSMARILREHRVETGASVHATSFVIVSPQARMVLDRTCMVGRGWWTDAWWCEAVHEGLLAIESHSWDHNHETLPSTAQVDGRTGTFRSIDDWKVADAELRQASDWLDAHCPGQRTRLLAYPYGETNDYLVREYLPRFQHQHRLQAAFTTEPAPLTAASDRWRLPRFVCGRDWKSPGELGRILGDCAPGV